MRIIVTGGAGFIGSGIVNELIKNDHSVLVIDNFSAAQGEFINKHAQYIKMDILSNKLPLVFQNYGPDIVIHLAAQINVQKSIKLPKFDANVNTLGTIALLEQCVKYKVKKIIYSSSAAVYGNPEYLAIDEKHPINPISHYGLSKYTSELYIQLYSKLFNLDYTILRYSNVYGFRNNLKGEGGVVSLFFNKLLNNKSPVIFGDGTQTRDFIYIKDVVSANVAALTNGSKRTYNVSSNKPTSINELISVIQEIANKKIFPIYQAAKNGEITHSYLDNTLARKELKWEPTYSLYDGLSEVYEDYVHRYFYSKMSKR